MDTWRSIREDEDRNCPVCRSPLPGDGAPCPSCTATRRARPAEDLRRDPRLALALGALALGIAAFAIFSTMRLSGRNQELREETARLRTQAERDRQAMAAAAEDEKRGLQAQVAALGGERDALKNDLIETVNAAAVRQAEVERELDVLRQAALDRPRPEAGPAAPPAAADAPEKKKDPEALREAPPVKVAPPEPPKSEPPKADAPPPRPPPPVLPAALEARIRQQIDRLRKDPAERRAATDALLDLRRKESKVREAICWFLEDERDPRVQARLRYVLEAVELLPLWERTLGLGRSPSNEAVANDSLLVVGVWGAGFAALQSGNGSQAWFQKEGVSAVYAPVLAGNHLVSIHVPAGSTQWGVYRTRLGDGISDGLPCKLTRGQSRIAADGDHFVYAPDASRIECRDVRSGQRRWDTATFPSVSSFAMASGRVFFLDPRRRLVCLPITGVKEAWAEAVNGVSVIGTAGDCILVADAAGALLACEAASGKVRWSIEGQGRTGVVSVTASDGCALLRSYSSWTCADLATGKTLWTRPAAVQNRASPIALQGMLASAAGGEVVLHDLRTGREMMRRGFGQPVMALASYRDRLYVVMQDSAAALEVR